MQKMHSAVFIFLCFTCSAIAAANIALSGTVKDNAGAGIPGVSISLVSDTAQKATTNVTGEFTIGSVSVIKENGAQNVSLQSIGIHQNQLRFAIVSPAESGTISLFSCSGTRFNDIPLGRMEAGFQTQILPELAPGFYLLHITIDQSVSIMKLVNTGISTLIQDNQSGAKSASRISRTAAASKVDTLIAKKSGYKTTKVGIASLKQTGITIVMAVEPVYAYSAAVENTCSDCKVADLPDGSKLTVKNSKLPDPFKKLDGTRISKKSEWRCRRQEILKQAMKYIYGEKPEPPEVVTGTVSNTKISVHVEDKGKKMDFSATIKLPSSGTAPYPAIIAMGSSNTVVTKVSSLGVAVITYTYSQVATPGSDGKVNRNTDFKGPFYDMYGTGPAAGNMMAWAWGASRLIDVLQKSGGAIIDYRRLAVTGCSRDGKDAFAVGLFDERIALTIPEESSLGGMVAYRVADAKCTEKTQYNYRDQIWLSNNFSPFVSNTSLLPIDAHSLIATIAPRGFYGIENSSDRPSDMANPRQMCPQGGNMAVQGADSVYKALGCSQNLSYNSTPTDIGHCGYSEKYTASLTANVKKFLLHQPAETGNIDAGTVEKTTDWIDWTAPTLIDDTDLYETD
jgi:hypothetical protein